MATYYDELIRNARNMDTIGMNPTNTGAQRTGVSETTTGRQGTAKALAAGAQRFVPGVAPRQRTQVPTGAADRVTRALATYGTADNSRTTAEAGVNPQIAEQLRLNLINQQRIQQNLNAPGAMNPVEYRAALREAQTNQAAVDAGITGINAMREAAVTARGQDVESATILTDRELSETGAFDRAMANLDVANLQGQYGLGRAFLQGSLQRDAVVAGKQALNPLEAARLRIGAGIEQGIADLPADKQAPVLAAIMDQYAGQPLAPAFAPSTQTATLPDGSTIELSDDRALALAAMQDPNLRAVLEAEGYVVGSNGALQRVTGQGQAAPGNGRQITTQPAGGGVAAPVPTAPVFPVAPTAGARVDTNATGTGFGVGAVTAFAREQQGRQAMTEIDTVLNEGFPATDPVTRDFQVRRWASNRKDYIATLSEADQKKLYAKLGEAVKPYLTTDVTGDN